MTNFIVLYCMIYYMHIIYVNISKLFLTLIINNNNCLYYNIIIYKLNFFINIIILKILI